MACPYSCPRMTQTSRFSWNPRQEAMTTPSWLCKHIWSSCPWNGAGPWGECDDIDNHCSLPAFAHLLYYEKEKSLTKESTQFSDLEKCIQQNNIIEKQKTYNMRIVLPEIVCLSFVMGRSELLLAGWEDHCCVYSSISAVAGEELTLHLHVTPIVVQWGKGDWRIDELNVMLDE